MSTFVGRSQELQWLLDRFDRALAGEGGVVFITGEAGAGKSTLTERFLLEAALKAPQARVISTDCSEQYGAGEPYQPFVEAFRDLLVGEDKPAGKRSIGELARELAPYWVQAIPVAGDIIVATMTTAVELKKSMGGAAAVAAAPSEEALFFQYTELFLAVVAEYPVILFIDDLHWADRASVSLLGHLGRKIADKPALIVGTYRAADVEVAKHPLKQAKLELQRYKVADELALEALDSSSLAEYVEQELGGPATPELLHLLERRAGSNPLFFGELLRWLVEQEHAVERDGEWGLSHTIEEIEIPRSVESVIEKRLGRLDPDVYRVLEYASVEGDEFDSTVLAQLLDMDELELEEQLEPLVRTHKLIRLEETRDLPNGEPTSVYEFSHTLIQDVFHKNLQGKRRILLHRKVAGILEEIFALDTESISHKLAYHFDQGRVPERAFEFAIRASDRASRVYAHWDAIELLQIALRNVQTEPQKVDALDRLGEENRFVGHYPEALINFTEALNALGGNGDKVRQLSLKAKVAMVERDVGDRPPEALIELLESLAQDAREVGAKHELCEILWNLGLVPGVTHDPADEALETAQQLQDPDLTARAHYMLARALMFGDHPENAVPHVREALEHATGQDDKVRMGRCYNVLAIVQVLLGEYREAAESFDSAATLFDEIGDPEQERSVRNNLGQLLIRLGAWDEAEENLTEAIRLAKRMGATARLIHPLENMARLFHAKGDGVSAGIYYTQLLSLAEETGYWNAEIVARCGSGTLRLESGDLEGARDELEAARALIHGEGWTEEHEDTELLAARIASAEGNRAAALEGLRRAAQELASRDRYLWAMYRLEEADLLAADDAQQARERAEEVLQVFQELGATHLAERTEKFLAALEG